MTGYTGNTDQPVRLRTRVCSIAHRCNERLESVQHAEHVDVEDGLEYGAIFLVFGQGTAADAGVGNDDIGNAVTLYEIECGLPHGALVAYVDCIYGAITKFRSQRL